MQKLVHLPHVPLRKSHLDSGTYRTLVRILSHCINDPLIHPSPPTPPNPNQYEERNRLAGQDIPVSDRNPNEVLSIDSSREGDKATRGRSIKDATCQTSTIHGPSDGAVDLVEEAVHGKGREGDDEYLVYALPKEDSSHLHLDESLGRTEAGEAFRECNRDKLVGDFFNGNFLSVEVAGNVNGQQIVDECVDAEQQTKPFCENPAEVVDDDGIAYSMGKLDHGDRREGHSRCSSSMFLNDIATEEPRLPDCQHEAFCPVEELGHEQKNHGNSDESTNDELLKDLVDEDSKAINAPSDIFCLVEESGSGGQEDKNISCIPNAPEEPRLPDCQHEAFCPVEELGHGQKNHRNSDESANDELVKDPVDEDSKAINAPSDIFCESGNRVQEDKNISCIPNADFSQLGNLARELRLSESLKDEKEIEEGEISDDLGVLDQSSDSGFEHVFPQERVLEEEALSYEGDTTCLPGTSSSSKVEENNTHLMTGRIAIKETGPILTVYGERDTWTYTDDKALKPQDYGAVPVNLRLTTPFLENIPVANESHQSNANDVDFFGRKKRAPLTESRKEKKKRAKKRKRAEQNRKLGVKRLKLQPITKPKKVIYCNFYMKGRCQQGDLCKFSHDTTPLTKSQPCKYYASESCLKGEDCPFDHQLSNYPCHNFISKGMCSRGDTCKFSHKMPIGEGSLAASKINETDSSMPLAKSSLSRQLTIDSTSVVNYTSRLAQPLSEHTHTAKSLSEKNIKPPARIPKGLRFLSFGSESVDEIDKNQMNVSKGGFIKTDRQHKEVVSDNLRNSNAILVGSSGLCLSSRQHIKPLIDGHENTLSPVSKPPLLANYKSNVSASRVIQSQFANMESKTSPCSSGRSTTSYSGNLSKELSDATKILEEFLLSGDI